LALDSPYVARVRPVRRILRRSCVARVARQTSRTGQACQQIPPTPGPGRWRPIGQL